MKTLSSYIKSDKSSFISLNEKLIINKKYKNVSSKLFIPHDVHITGEETCKNIIDGINDSTMNQKSNKVNDWFKGMNRNILEFCFCDITEDDADNYEKSIGKIFTKDPRDYMPEEYINFESDDDHIPINWNDYDSLSKFERDDGNYVIVWIMKNKILGKEHTLIYIFI